MPIAAYTLDDDFDLSRINDYSPPDSPIDPTNLLRDMLTLSQSTPLASLPTPVFSNLPGSNSALAQALVPEQRNTLKRPQAFDDDSYDKISLRPTKKQRIQPLQLVPVLDKSVFDIISATDSENYVTDVQSALGSSNSTAKDVNPDHLLPNLVSKTSKSDLNSNLQANENNPVTPRRVPQPVVEVNSNIKPKDLESQHVTTHKLPNLLSLLPKSKSQLTCKPTRAWEKTNERFARLIKPFDPSSVLHSSPMPARIRIAKPHPTPTQAQTESKLCPHTAFWETARNSYSGDGPLVISINDILRPTPTLIRSTPFLVNGCYLDKQFTCHAF